ncbi:tyrosine-type recombinase/integrase [Nocardioides bruguierae]|uniref:Tyrosine-type recombinase/integrase n=1 Tax=Nocardioides bruguierae TaxID=2945102 RepID=A0A9X2DCY2_9ACTN|nr:tyrosine-type recombinase/integrase [Nocardioides bruguierae]MCM0622199.1 tyrosine-type recombinase/integrase [Nocardioides bruguierae]
MIPALPHTHGAGAAPDDPLAVAWLEHMDRQGTAVNTIRARVRVLRSLAASTGRPLADLTREDCEAWWDSRAHLAPATRSNDLACLRAFFKWAARWEHRADDPTNRLDAPKVPQGLPHPVSRADLQTLLTELDGDLRRAVCLGAYAGLRVAEAAALRWEAIDTEARRITVLGKGQKTRAVGLSPLLLDQLLPATGGNVVTAGGDTYTAANLQRKVNRAIRAAGVEETFHGLRHRFGTLAYASTGDLLGVSRAMGHASVTTTAIYAATGDEVLDRIAVAVAR